MDSLRMGKIKVDRKVSRNLVLETKVRRVNSRISIVLTEHAHAGAEWNAAARGHRDNVGPSRRLGGSSETSEGEGAGANDSKLLRAIVGD